MSDDAHTVHRISEREAAENLSGVLDRVRDGESFEVVRDDQVVARIVPSAPVKRAKVKTLAELVAAIQSGPRLDPEDSVAFEKDLEAIRKAFPMQEREWD